MKFKRHVCSRTGVEFLAALPNIGNKSVVHPLCAATPEEAMLNLSNLLQYEDTVMTEEGFYNRSLRLRIYGLILAQAAGILDKKYVPELIAVRHPNASDKFVPESKAQMLLADVKSICTLYDNSEEVFLKTRDVSLGCWNKLLLTVIGECNSIEFDAAYFHSHGIASDLQYYMNQGGVLSPHDFGIALKPFIAEMEDAPSTSVDRICENIYLLYLTSVPTVTMDQVRQLKIDGWDDAAFCSMLLDDSHDYYKFLLRLIIAMDSANVPYNVREAVSAAKSKCRSEPKVVTPSAPSMNITRRRLA